MGSGDNKDAQRDDQIATITGAMQAQPQLRRQPARLVVVHPPELRETISLTQGELVLGRAPESKQSHALAHPAVSRQHVRVRGGRRGGHIVHDLGSYNGTWIDGARLESEAAELDDGSVVRLADVVMIYEHLGPDREGERVSRDALPGEAPRMRTLRHLVQKAAGDPSPALIIGDTGTGKEMLARELHRLSGRQGDFVALNCAAISAQLVESQLFGHEKGAFTGATSVGKGLFRAADGGTLFLDELGEMELGLQPKLLRAIQERVVRPVGSTRTHPVDVRVVAATNRDIVSEVEAGRFRRDLYARLALWELKVPALCERRSDILSWIVRLHGLWHAERGETTLSTWALTAEAAEHLLLHRWPENLREIERLVHRLVALDLEDDTVALGDVEEVLGPRASERQAATSDPSHELAAASKQRTSPSREELEAALEACEGSVRAVAKHFGRDRKQIYRWMTRYGLK